MNDNEREQLLNAVSMLHDAGFMSSHEAASMYWNIVEGSIESIADDLENRGDIEGTVVTEDYLISLEEYVDSIVKRLRRLAKNMKTMDGHDEEQR